MLRRLLELFRPADGAPVKVIIGLGNPGREYESTRHNVGWWVIDHLADVWRFEAWRRDGEALATTGVVGEHRVRLLKPLTFMNLSGAVLRPFLRREGWSARTDLLIIVDEVALPVGRIRIRAGGSAGGHNGLKSIEQALGHQDYARLRIGIRPEDPRRSVGDLSNFVLSPFGRDEREQTLAIMPRVREAVELWLRDGVGAAMNIHNQ
ncbi:MAG TPA: aminoacyl-tRNA hydrolase [Gemmatimonadaceae bacterium]|nr:aminoacyl-tRNA hydrolase [Gemmatimonadaceae bacterium]